MSERFRGLRMAGLRAAQQAREKNAASPRKVVDFGQLRVGRVIRHRKIALPIFEEDVVTPAPTHEMVAAVRESERWAKRLRSDLTYTLEEKLGEGHEGQVWRAEDSEGTKVAIKFGKAVAMLDFRSHFDLIYTMERQEISTIGILQLIGSGGTDEDTGLQFYPMPLMDGTLQDEVDKTVAGLRPSRVIGVGVLLLDIIMRIHRVGFLHLDVKPSNIMYGKHEAAALRIRLIDYGNVSRYTGGRVGEDAQAPGSPGYTTIFGHEEGALISQWLDIEAWIIVLQYAYKKRLPADEAPIDLTPGGDTMGGDRNAWFAALKAELEEVFVTHRDEPRHPKNFYRTTNQPFAALMSKVPRGARFGESRDTAVNDVSFVVLANILATVPFSPRAEPVRSPHIPAKP